MSKILIVEDGLIVAFHIQKIVESMGHQVVNQITRAEHVVDAVKKSSPDLIFLDIMLEGQMTGIDAAREVRKISNSPIVFMSALSDNKTANTIDSITHSITISKPFEDATLITAINKILA